MMPIARGWEELPTDLFMHLCSKLDLQHVFGILPQLCQQFNDILSAHSVAFDHLELHGPSYKLMLKLMEEVSACKSLDLLILVRNFDVEDILSNFLHKLSRTMKSFKVAIECSVDQKFTTTFINSSRLQRLEINVLGELKWEWSLHTVRPSIREVKFSQSELEFDVCAIFKAFPNLKRFVYESNRKFRMVEDIRGDESGIIPDKLTYYQSVHRLPPFKVLGTIEHMVLVYGSNNFSQLLHYLRKMKKLQILDFELIQCQPDLTVAEAEQLVKLLVQELATMSNLTAVKLSVQCCNSWGWYSETEMPYDSLVIEMFENFASRVKHITYKGNVIRLA
jgi:hypothetical protein